SARRTVISSKSLPGRIWRKRSAALALGVSRISTRTIVRSLRPRGVNLPFWEGVLREMSGMAFRRVAAPVDHEVGAVLDFTNRAGPLPAQLGGDFRWPV